MTTAKRKYYVRVPPAFSHDGGNHWQELLDVKSLTSAQHYVSKVFGGLADAEIWAPRAGEIMRAISKKNADGKWQLVYSPKTDADDLPNCYYHLDYHRFSRKDFYKYGFPHEKQTVAAHNKNI